MSVSQNNFRPVPITRGMLENFIASRQKKASAMLSLKSIMFFVTAVIVFVTAAFILIIQFYMAPVLLAKSRFMQVRNLTPVVEVPSNADGVLERLFVRL